MREHFEGKVYMRFECFHTSIILVLALAFLHGAMVC